MYRLSFGIFSEYSIDPHLDHAKKSFAEDTCRHFRGAEGAVGKYNRHFNQLTAMFYGGIFHFYLESIADKFNFIKIDGLQYFTLVAHKAGGEILYIDTRYKTHIY